MSRPALAAAGAISVAAMATAAVVVAVPLLVYAATLALFGFAHVVVELCYVRDRFAARISARLWIVWSALLLALVALRSLGVAGIALPFPRIAAELAVLAALLVATSLALARERRVAGVLAAATLAALLFVVHPAATLAFLAFVHNLTPLGFLAERWRGAERVRALLLAAIAFVAVPCWIGFGGAECLLTQFGVAGAQDPIHSGGAFLGIGEPMDHYHAFLPTEWHAVSWAPRLFAVAVYLQCAHYFVVLHVLPQMAGKSSLISNLRFRFAARAALGAAVVIGAALLVRFAQSFADGRSLYGIAAAVHAFIEWPLFLAVALGAAREPAIASVPA